MSATASAGPSGPTPQHASGSISMPTSSAHFAPGSQHPAPLRKKHDHTAAFRQALAQKGITLDRPAGARTGTGSATDAKGKGKGKQRRVDAGPDGGAHGPSASRSGAGGQEEDGDEEEEEDRFFAAISRNASSQKEREALRQRRRADLLWIKEARRIVSAAAASSPARAR